MAVSLQVLRGRRARCQRLTLRAMRLHVMGLCLCLCLWLPPLAGSAADTPLDLDEAKLRSSLGPEAIVIKGRRFFAAACPDPAADWDFDACAASLGAAVEAAEALFDGFVERFDRDGAMRRRAEDQPYPYALYLFATREAMRAFFQRSGEPWLERVEHMAVGYFLGTGRMAVLCDGQRGLDAIMSTVRHEVGHLLWRTLGGLDESECGIGGDGYWVVEGLAVELEAGPGREALELHRLRNAHEALQQGELPALDALLQMDREQFLGRRDKWCAIHYAAAWALAHLLLTAPDPQLRSAFLDYVIALETMPPQERRPALLMRLNTTLVDLERDWRAHIAALAERHRDALKDSFSERAARERNPH